MDFGFWVACLWDGLKAAWHIWLFVLGLLTVGPMIIPPLKNYIGKSRTAAATRVINRLLPWPTRVLATVLIIVVAAWNGHVTGLHRTKIDTLTGVHKTETKLLKKTHERQISELEAQLTVSRLRESNKGDKPDSGNLEASLIEKPDETDPNATIYVIRIFNPWPTGIMAVEMAVVEILGQEHTPRSMKLPFLQKDGTSATYFLTSAFLPGNGGAREAYLARTRVGSSPGHAIQAHLCDKTSFKLATREEPSYIKVQLYRHGGSLSALFVKWHKDPFESWKMDLVDENTFNALKYP